MTSRDNQRLVNILAVLGGVVFALLVVVLFIWLSGDDDGGAVTTVTTSATTTTTAPATTTTGPATTTTADSTTTTSTASTTTTIAFDGDTTTKTNDTITGEPGPYLTDVRVGDHPGFVRIVFNLSGDGTPLYTVGYQDPPFLEISGEEVDVDGTAFIHVTISPALTYDIDTFEPVYEGDEEIRPGFDPVVELQLLGDFEAYLEWVIGLDGEHAFTVAILQDPLRVVIDIAK